MKRRKLVVVGNGMAPGRALEELFERAPDAYDVTIFNAEPRVNYNRIMLSPVLSGEKTFEDIIIHDERWYADRGVTLHKGDRVTAIDRGQRTVVSERGATARYDALILATGSTPVVIPVPGHKLPSVLTYRDLDDVHAMLLAARAGGRAVVIGGGLLGLEAAAGLREQGMEVTVLHLMPTLMERQLDASAGYLLERAIRDRGIEVITRANTREIIGDTRVEGVRLEDGRTLPADIVVMAVGIRPNVQLAREAGIAVNRGIIVDAGMCTSDPHVHAVGECVEFEGNTYGLVAPLYDMASTLGRRLAGDSAASFVHSQTSTKLKVTGVDLFSAGEFAEGEGRADIVLRDIARGYYRRLVMEGERLVGAVLYGDTGDGPYFFNLIRSGEAIDAEARQGLIFGPAFQGGAPLDPMAAVAALPDDAEICGCNGISKGRICSAIESRKLCDVEGVRAHTKASSSCGTCTGLVEKLLQLKLGDGFKGAAKGICPCTDLGHGEIRRLIRVKALMSMPALMQELGWRSADGCARCRPALNYYLLCEWPGAYQDDQQSRFINERVHANIQKDGTYSVVPRMWGGVTSAKELRAIADVVEKFAIPMVKCTGGQRIDMLGVRKEDLPAVWADLNAAGMVSGHAYGKALRTVKTCVGSEWCRFGTQDSTGLGIRLERYLWGSWTPAKVKLAVSGCPRNCSEATCKDIGVICVDSGYEIHFAGAAGLDIKGTEILTRVPTEDATVEMIAALLQLYREEGYYLERIYKWAKRVGSAHVVARIVEDHESRRELVARFEQSQSFLQEDPWAPRARGERDAHEFRKLAPVEA